MNVTVKYVHDEWLATIDGKDPCYFGTGDTADEAVGDLVTSFQATCGLIINGGLSIGDGLAVADQIKEWNAKVQAGTFKGHQRQD